MGFAWAWDQQGGNQPMAVGMWVGRIRTGGVGTGNVLGEPNQQQ